MYIFLYSEKKKLIFVLLQSDELSIFFFFFSLKLVTANVCKKKSIVKRSFSNFGAGRKHHNQLPSFPFPKDNWSVPYVKRNWQCSCMNVLYSCSIILVLDYLILTENFGKKKERKRKKNMAVTPGILCGSCC
jgi:hypothetical protein